MQDDKSWSECIGAVRQLQWIAKQLKSCGPQQQQQRQHHIQSNVLKAPQSLQLLGQTLQLLTLLRQELNSQLLQRPPLVQFSVEALERMEAIKQKAQDRLELQTPTVDQLAEERRQWLRNDLKAMLRLVKPPSPTSRGMSTAPKAGVDCYADGSDLPHSPCVDLDDRHCPNWSLVIETVHQDSHELAQCFDQQQRNPLVQAVCMLRAQEERIDFHRQLLRDQLEMSQLSSYSQDNFSYGTTPFTTWFQVLQSAAVQLTLTGDQEHLPVKRIVSVFGSSTGLLVFYTLLCFPNVQCSGYELLPSLVQVATRICSQLAISSEQCQFFQQDMLDADVSKTQMVVLTSLCWDSTLCDRVYAKLDKELPESALIVDYRDRFANKFKSFQKCHRIQGPVSWISEQDLHVFQKKSDR